MAQPINGHIIMTGTAGLGELQYKQLILSDGTRLQSNCQARDRAFMDTTILD